MDRAQSTLGDARVDGLAAFAPRAAKAFYAAGALWKRVLAVAPTRPDNLFAALPS